MILKFPKFPICSLELPMDAFEDQLSSSEGGDPEGFTYYFLSTKGNEFFCEIDDEYILDRFNLTGISTEVHHFQLAFEMLTDNFEHEVEDEMRELVEASARLLHQGAYRRWYMP